MGNTPYGALNQTEDRWQAWANLDHGQERHGSSSDQANNTNPEVLVGDEPGTIACQELGPDTCKEVLLLVYIQTIPMNAK